MEQGCLLQKDHNSKTYPISLGWLTDATLNTTSGTGFNEYSFRRFCERVVPTVEDEKGVRCKRLPSEESAYSPNFQSNININAHDFNMSCLSFKNNYQIVIYHHGNVIKEKHSMMPHFYTEGPSDDAWTVSDWVFDVSKECTFPDIDEISLLENELDQISNRLSKGILVDRPESLYALANKVAVEIEGKEKENINEWAEKLSENLSKLTD